MAALGADPERREQRAAARDRLVDRADRRVAGGVVVGARADEREHLVRVGHGDRAVAELLEQLVGDRARGALGQPAPQLGQRRLEQLEHGRLAPRPAHAAAMQPRRASVDGTLPGQRPAHVQHRGSSDAQAVPVSAAQRLLAVAVDEDRVHADAPRAGELVVRAVADEHRLVRLDAERARSSAR